MQGQHHKIVREWCEKDFIKIDIESQHSRMNTFKVTFSEKTRRTLYADTDQSNKSFDLFDLSVDSASEKQKQ